MSAPIVSKNLLAIRTIEVIIWKSLDRLDRPNSPKRELTQVRGLILLTFWRETVSKWRQDWSQSSCMDLLKTAPPGGGGGGAGRILPL